MKFIKRQELMEKVLVALDHFPVTLILGPRQCGKTTLARSIWKERGGSYFDLEDPETPLQEDIAKLTLESLEGLVVIDEFQCQPGLFPLLRVLADRRPLPARFLILGSASLELVKGVSESLAGRVAYIFMDGFSVNETGMDQHEKLWFRGGFPLSFLANSEKRSQEWRTHFMQSFLERDIPQLGIRVGSPILRRFWTMMAHFHGRVWNAAELARSLGSKEDTARYYLDILTGAFMIRQISPWYENIGKRMVKAPKVFVRDSGILHSLLGIKDRYQLLSNPKLGFSWEGFVIEQIFRLTGIERDAYFYKTYAGAELDLLLFSAGKRFGFEFNVGDAPRSTRSMHIVMEDLKLERLWVVYPGKTGFPLGENIDVIPFNRLPVLLSDFDLIHK